VQVPTSRLDLIQSQVLARDEMLATIEETFHLLNTLVLAINQIQDIGQSKGVIIGNIRVQKTIVVLHVQARQRI